MPIQLNHTIVPCRDAAKSAAFVTDILGLPPPQRFLHFVVVDLDNGVSLDFGATDEAIPIEHYAFLVSDAEFDAAIARLEAKAIPIFADPFGKSPGINHHFGGRGAYFRDPDGHVLEVITKPYAR